MSNNNSRNLQGNLFPIHELEDQNESIMGILNDGTPYLTMYGLAKFCGVEPSALWAFTSKWNSSDNKPRTQYIAKILLQEGYDTTKLFTRVRSKKGIETHAYPDYICMAILEYYAFEAKRFNNAIARTNYKKIASYTLRKLIYDQLGIDSDANKVISRSWQVYQERIKLNDQIPYDYFSIFREMADLLVRLINSQFNLDPYSIPDISVGKHWSKYWTSNKLECTYGKRIQHPHNYPESFPQSKSNPVPTWIYPINALGVFRQWLMTTYVKYKLAPYLENKVKQKTLPIEEKEQILSAILQKGKQLH